MSEIILVRDKNKVILLEGKLALINWVSQLVDEFYKVGVTYVGEYPYGGGSSEWIVEVTEEGLIPLACSLYEGWEEVVKLRVSEKILVEKGGEKGANL